MGHTMPDIRDRSSRARNARAFMRPAPPPPCSAWSPSPAPFHFAGADKRIHSRDTARAPSPRVRGEGRDEGASPLGAELQGSDSRQRPLTLVRFAHSTSPRTRGEVEQANSFSRRIVCVRALPYDHHEDSLRLPKKGKRSAERRIVLPMSASSAAARCPGATHPPFGAHACGTRHRLLPRWLSPRTAFPAAWRVRSSAGLCRWLRLSTLRADRSFCRSSGGPEPPESELQIRARAPHLAPPAGVPS
jgi:hypothetical protein